ncbi:hypothetical protein M378DRAFT_129682 [Amanita muscaria Koide BX008]|uniref:Uncharacterized protein n=1 Tax=Amanita muscaria (strain Koide BX008) TaxID=946122 RepID=A0A0C2WXP0_AMAMK|nr:hypothetical protein M378DRAFT_129682 [Amanita muscaria Koide BX008]
MLIVIQRAVVSVIIQALLYGIYLSTLIQCIRWLMFTDEGWKPRERMNSLTIAFATIFIFLTSTTNVINEVQYTLGRLVRDEYRRMYGIVMATVLLQQISALLTVLSVDGVLIYRCWIVYAKSWGVICVPVICCLGSLACSVLIMMIYGSTTLNSDIQKKALTGLYGCIIGTSTYTTTAIIYRIWYARKTSGSSPKRLNYLMRILAESGILYTSTIIFSLATSLIVSGNDSTWVEVLIYEISDAISFCMAGISYNLILIRVYQSRVELRDTLADSRNVGGENTLSGMRFNNAQITASLEEPSSNPRDEGIDTIESIDEIQEHRRSSDGMHRTEFGL